MSACQKCWSDAHRGPDYSVAEEYARLIDMRWNNPCTPEEQAGPDAGECPRCHRKTLHQHTAEPMCGCPSIFEKPSAEAIEAVRADLEV